MVQFLQGNSGSLLEKDLNGGRRLGYIDIAKGLGMLTIIWGHICLRGISNHIVYSFHIPLFFFLSGLVFAPKRYANIGVFLRKRWKGLLVPYVVYSFLTWVVWAFYSYVTHAQVDSYWMPLLQTLIAQGSEGFLVHNVPLWFVMCLFSVEVIYYFLSKMKDWINVFICVILCIAGVLSTKASFFDFSLLPWSIDVALMALPFYATGSLLAKHVPHAKQVEAVMSHKVLSIILFVMAAMAVYLGASYNGHVSMGHADLGRSSWVFYGTAVFGVFGFMILCIAVSLFSSKVVDCLKWIGSNSFRVMAVHNPIKGIVIISVAKLLHTSATKVSYSEMFSLIAFVVTLLTTLVIVWIIDISVKKMVVLHQKKDTFNKTYEKSPID